MRCIAKATLVISALIAVANACDTVTTGAPLCYPTTVSSTSTTVTVDLYFSENQYSGPGVCVLFGI